MLDDRAVLYVVVVLRESKKPARERPGAVSVIEDPAQGIMIRTEDEYRTVEVQPERHDTLENG